MLSVVLPAYNEEAVIERVIAEHVSVLEELTVAGVEWEIVCVEDGSADHTREALARIQKRVPQLRVILHSQNQGIYASFAHLYREAKGSLIYSTGSDGQWPAEHLKRLLAPVRAGADLAVGVRTNRCEVYSLRRRLVSFAYNRLSELAFGVPIRDAGGVKLGRREMFGFELLSRSPFSEAERVIRAQREGWKVVFVPIDFRARPAGADKGASWRNIFASMRDLVRCVRAYGARGEATAPIKGHLPANQDR
jgi:glycosyltransferase involved in cell wall biosynthesis